MPRIELASDFAPSPAWPKEPTLTGSSRLPEVTRPEMDEGNPELVEAVYAALKTVHDPEIPVNLVDLGLIYEIAAREERPRLYRDDADNARLPGGWMASGPGPANRCLGAGRQHCAREALVPRLDTRPHDR